MNRSCVVYITHHTSFSFMQSNRLLQLEDCVLQENPYHVGARSSTYWAHLGVCHHYSDATVYLRTHTHTHTHALFLAHGVSLTLFLPPHLSLSHTHTHTRMLVHARVWWCIVEWLQCVSFRISPPSIHIASPTLLSLP
jgi:hypothetical protein